MMQPATINQPAGQVLVAAAPQSSMNVKAVQSLGIVQIIFGAITFTFGILAIIFDNDGDLGTYATLVSHSGTGIWLGIWILVTGIIGSCSIRQSPSRCSIGTNMGFNIVCTVISFVSFIFCAVVASSFSKCNKFRNVSVSTYVDYNYLKGSRYPYYCENNMDVGIAIYSILMILMMAEFAVSLAISIFCCKSIGCDRLCCQTSQVIPSTNNYPVYPMQGRVVSNPGVVLQPGMIQQQYPQQQGMAAQPRMVQQAYST